MFGNILGKKKEEKEENSELKEKISKMNLTDMKFYVSDKMDNFRLCPDGAIEVLKKLTTKDANGKRYVEADAMDTKMQKAFDVVILINSGKHVTVATAELSMEFLKIYDDILKKYDREHKEIYQSRIKDSVDKSLNTISVMANVNNKMNALS